MPAKPIRPPDMRPRAHRPVAAPRPLGGPAAKPGPTSRPLGGPNQKAPMPLATTNLANPTGFGLSSASHSVNGKPSISRKVK